MKRNPAARRYAHALFDLARAQGMESLNTYGKELAALALAIRETPRLQDIFKNPIFSVQEKQSVLGRLLDALGASQHVQNFCLLLADKNRLSILQDVQEVYASLLDQEQRIVRGEVKTAVPLLPERQKALADQLEEKAGYPLNLIFTVDPSILGGLTLRIGDRVLDASLAAQLDSLRETIRRGM